MQKYQEIAALSKQLHKLVMANIDPTEAKLDEQFYDTMDDSLLLVSNLLTYWQNLLIFNKGDRKLMTAVESLYLPIVKAGHRATELLEDATLSDNSGGGRRPSWLIGEYDPLEEQDAEYAKRKAAADEEFWEGIHEIEQAAEQRGEKIATIG